MGKISLDDKEFSKGIDNAEKSFTKFSSNFKTVIGSVGKVGEAFGTGLSPKVLEAQTRIRELNIEVSKSSRYWGKNSEQALIAKRALTDYVLGLDDATFKQSFMKSQLGLTSRQLLDQASSIKINYRMTKLMGDQTQILTERMKGLAQHGIKPEMLLPTSAPGAFKILNETLAVSGKGIYGLSAGFRAFGNRIEKVTKGFALQKQVVKAANGDMVKYGLLMRGASAGLANLGLTFPIVGLASGLFYGKLINMAIEGDKQTQKLADTFKNKLGKAFEPMLDIVNDLVQGFLKVGTSVADFMIKFNEAHPVIAKFIQGIALLTPAMTLLLLPLNLGLGLFKGWGVVIGSVSKLIMPFITSIGLASSTFLTLAGIIGVVAGAFTYFYNTNETFKNGVLAAWNLIKEGFHAVFDPIITYLTETLPAAFEAGGLSGVFTTLGNTFTQLLTYLYTNLPRFLEIGLQMIGNILNGIATNLPTILSKGTEIITNLLNGILAMMPSLIESAASIISSYAEYIANNLPIIIEKGIELLNALVEGISNNL
ncbi:MAG: phage tail protein, partial [Peptostreptococcaceae bacterium]